MRNSEIGKEGMGKGWNLEEKNIGHRAESMELKIEFTQEVGGWKVEKFRR